MNRTQTRAHDATGRLGLLGHGTYYLLLTLLCARLLLGGGGEETNADGAIATVARQHFGQVLLVGLLLAFGAYAAMRWIAVVREDELADRAKNAVQGVVWTALSVLTGNALLHGVRRGDSGGGAGSITQSVLEAPGGQWLISAAGLVLAGVAVHQFRKATGHALGSELQELGIDGRRAARILGRVGYLGRALAYGLVAAFVLHAAWTHDPESATRGLDGALDQTRQSAYQHAPAAAALRAPPVLALLQRLAQRRGEPLRQRSRRATLQSDGAPDGRVVRGRPETHTPGLPRAGQSRLNSCVCGLRRSSRIAPPVTRSLTRKTLSPRVISDS